MSTPFTVTSANSQYIAKREELRLAYSERYYEINGSYRAYRYDDTTASFYWDTGDGTSADTLANNEPPQGFSALSLSFFTEIQSFFITNALSFAPKWDGVTDPYDDDGTFTLAYVDLNDAFSKVSDDMFDGYDYGFRYAYELYNGSPDLYAYPATSYDGDYHGTWLIDDLVSALSGMSAVAGDDEGGGSPT